LGKENKAEFWGAQWTNGNSPKSIAPTIYAISKNKKWMIMNAMHNNAWVQQIDYSNNLLVQHLDDGKMGREKYTSTS
jgi:hypothetical protein